MFTLTTTATYEQDIKKSRFLAIAGPAANDEQAKAFIAQHSDPTATHNCWAWRFGQSYRFNDAGEPTGTAGKPILQAIDGQQVDNVVVLVIRWFGGILLGAGGLIRAYGGTAALCLRNAEKSEIIAMSAAALKIGFSDLALVKARIGAVPGLKIDAETYLADGAELSVSLPEAEAAHLLQMVTDLTSGRAVIRFAD